jgi:hypothetical protein
MRQLIINEAFTLVAVAGLALTVSGQAASQVARRAPAATETRVRAAKSPYTAEYKITRVQALADGTTITEETTEVKELDSQGRRMTAVTVTSGSGRQTTHVSVYDPVARTQTFWQSPGKVAHVLQMSQGSESHCLTITRDDVQVASGPHAQYTSETIGTETIQGIETRGRRYITTIPVSAAGNDAPLVTTAERWTALTVGLDGLMVREVIDDPRRGRSTRELTNLNQGDPDPATFQPPEGYEIQTKDSSGCQDGPPAETTGGRTTTK